MNRFEPCVPPPNRVMQPRQLNYDSACSCFKEPGCWGQSGFHFYAVMVPAAVQERSCAGGRTETYTRPAYETAVAYERCTAYQAAIRRRIDERRQRESAT